MYLCIWRRFYDSKILLFFYCHLIEVGGGRSAARALLTGLCICWPLIGIYFVKDVFMLLLQTFCILCCSCRLMKLMISLLVYAHPHTIILSLKHHLCS